MLGTVSRRAVLSIVAGLDQEAWLRPVVPSGWTPAGLVEHLGDAPPQYRQGPRQYQQAPPPAAPAAAPSVYDQLSQLATLHDQGALTDDEFTAAKAKLPGT